MGLADIPETLGNKFGPLPIWAWGLVAGGVGLAVVKLRGGSLPSASAPLTASGGGTGYPTDSGSGLTGGGSTGGGGGGSSYPPVAIGPGQGVYDPVSGQVAGGAFLKADDIHNILDQINGSAITNVQYTAGSYGFSANNDDLAAINASLAAHEAEVINTNATAEHINFQNVQGATWITYLQQAGAAWQLAQQGNNAVSAAAAAAGTYNYSYGGVAGGTPNTTPYTGNTQPVNSTNPGGQPLPVSRLAVA
jgi:hypothetical protein